MTESVLAGTTFPLSPVQQGMAYHCAIDDPRVYMAQFACKLTGSLRVDLFRTAWDRVIQRHEVLRAGIEWRDSDVAVHAVHVHVQADWTEHVIDTARALEPQLAQLRSRERERSFDLTRPPLMRFLLASGGPGEHWFVWTWHHLIADGWSTAIVLDEVARAYRALVENRQEALPAAVSFRRYVDWLSSSPAEDAPAFWRSRLGGLSATSLAAGRERRAASPSAVHDLGFSEAETADLVAFARHRDLTLATVCYAAWALLLARFTGRREVVFGMTVSGRDAPIDGITRIVGPTINTLPVRSRVPFDRTVDLWLSSFQLELAELRANGQVSLSDILRHAGLSEEPFDTLVVFERALGARVDEGPPGPLRLSDADGTVPTHYPMTVAIAPEPTLAIRFTHDPARLDAADVGAIGRALRRILTSLPRSATRRVREVDYLAEPAVSFGPPPTTASTSTATSIVSLVETQVDATPDATAVRDARTVLTYAQLDRRANRLARYLRQQGIGTEMPVAVTLERRADLVVVLLAVLKAGGAYVPIEPFYPDARRLQLVRESGAGVLIGRDPLPGCGARHIDLAAIEHELAGQCPSRPEVAMAGDQVAYILYTSGSTGTPKGVALTHANAANLLGWAVDYFGRSRLARVAAVSSYCFDLSVFELFGPLVCGGETIVAESVADLGTLRACAPLTLLNTVPSAIGLLRDAGADRDLTTGLSLAGEALTGTTAAHARDLLAPEELFNLYGPSETTTYSVAHRVTPDEAAPAIGRVPIGRPVASTGVHVVDETGDLVPLGGEGELYISGAGVARGYWARPDLTADSFLPDPHGAPGSRRYRTGDRVHRLLDGSLEFLGRLDNQVKVRGYRIELGEVEAVIGQHPDVEESVVWMAGTATDPSVAGGWTGSATEAEVRRWLEARLPRYMVPGQLVRLEALPRLTNGKIDRRSLAGTAAVARAPVAEPRAARDSLESDVMEIWEQVLGRRVGRHQSFVEAGGHSLLGMGVIGRIRHVLGAAVPVRALFETASAAEFGAVVSAALTGRTGFAIPVIPRRGPIASSPAQQRLWFLEELAGRTGLYNVSLALRLRGPLDVPALRCALEQLVARHEVLRTTFEVTDDGTVRQRVTTGVEPAFRDLRADESQASTVAAAEAQRPFDLAEGPLLRTARISLGGDVSMLVLSLHHIVVDAWSVQILWRDLQALYHAACNGAVAALPPLRLQYADFAAYQRRALSSGALGGSLAYWRTQLAQLPPLDLLLDRPRPAVQTFRGSRQSRLLSAELSESLRRIARDAKATLFMVMTAAVQVLLARSARQQDFGVGIPAISRPSPDLEEVIGPFLNTLVLRADLSGDPTFLELLDRVRRRLLDAYAHQDVPFERVVEEVGVKRDTSRHPLFQVMLVFEQWSPPPPAPLGLSIERVDPDVGLSKFDMTLYVDAGGDAIGLAIEYSRDLFDPDTIDRYLRRWVCLLEAAVRDPGAPVFALQWLDEAERRELSTMNPPPHAFNAQPLSDTFEEQAGKTPHAIALVHGARSLSYAEVNGRANRLGRRLVELGVGPDVRVGLAVERSAEMIIALLAIWKAGAAYVPVDLTYPAERLRAILDDARPALIVVSDGARARLPRHSIPLVGVAAYAGGTPGETVQNLARHIHPDHLAYVIYTSGSTGTPKGIALPHRCLSNLISWHRRNVPVGRAVLQFASIGFDACVHEAFAAFAAGAALVVADEEDRRDPGRLAALMAAHQIDKAELPVVMLQRLADLVAAGEAELPALRTVTATGEQLRVTDSVRRMFARSGASLRNHYGPSETHLATAWVLPPEAAEWSDTPLIGSAIDNTRLAVVDARLQPVPVGIPGELYIGGVCLARSYWNRPDVTADRFIPDPFSPESGQRMYRSGDLVRLLPSGDLEFLGRLDHQLKIRGCRVEPAEVNAALESHPAVRRAVVVGCHVEGGGQLAAYVARDAEISAHELKKHLRARLPEYMIPALWTFVDDVPVNANGKVDYRALPPPSPSRVATAPLSPRSVAEARLVWIWEDVLRRRGLGVRDDFFECGGDSISAAVLVRRVREAFGQDIQVTALFQAPTVEQFAVLMRGAGERPRGPLMAIQPDGETPKFYCVHPVGGGVLCYTTFARALRRWCRFFGLQAPGFDGEREPLRTIPALAATYVQAILEDAEDAPLLIGGWSLGGKIAYEMARQLDDAGRPPRLVALFDTEARRPAPRAPDQAKLLAEMLQGRLELALDALRSLPEDEQVRHVLTAGYQAGVIADDVSAPDARRAIEVYRANLAADAAYEPEAYGGRLCLFRASDREVMPTDETLGWAGLARGGVDLHVCSGTHLTMIEDPERAEQLASVFRQSVADALR